MKRVAATGGGTWVARPPASRRRRVLLVAAVTLALAVTILVPARAETPTAPFEDAVNLVPAQAQGVGQCIPFGSNTRFGFSGFVYRNVPAFRLEPGSRFAFDLGAPNDVPVRRNIFFSAANRNPAPGDRGIRAVEWVQVASDAQVPENPYGNDVVGDYELAYAAEADFVFPGGGLVVGFGAAPPGEYRDPNCRQVLVHTSASDASGHFFSRFWNQSHLPSGDLDTGDWGTSFLGGIVIWPAGGDDVPPETEATLDPSPDAWGWSEAPVTVTLEARDDDSGVAEIRWSVDDGDEEVVEGETATVVLTQPGSRTLVYYAVDHAGNVESPNTLEILIAMPVGLDVLPGSPVNAVNVRRAGALPVAVLSAPGFDATALDPSELSFGTNGGETGLTGCRGRDVDGDGLADLVCHAAVSEAGFTPATEVAVLRGWMDDVPLLGRDAVRIVGSR